jgi:probable rRNA maturation factor
MARLKVRGRGVFVMAFVDSRLMRRLNREFAGHRGLTDVLSFRYEGEPVIGEVVVSPAFARQYAAAHGLPYRQELARYALHGLLHWLGHEDRTAAQRNRMHAMEDALLNTCGGK